MGLSLSNSYTVHVQVCESASHILSAVNPCCVGLFISHIHFDLFRHVLCEINAIGHTFRPPCMLVFPFETQPFNPFLATRALHPEVFFFL